MRMLQSRSHDNRVWPFLPHPTPEASEASAQASTHDEASISMRAGRFSWRATALKKVGEWHGRPSCWTRLVCQSREPVTTTQMLV